MNAAGGYVVTERMLEMFKPSTRTPRRRPGTPMNLHPQPIIDTSYFAAAFRSSTA